MLELLGLPPTTLSKLPSVACEFPPALRPDPDLKTYWTKLCLENRDADPETAWNTVFLAFIDWATRTNRRIWKDELNRVDNNEIEDYLMLRRRWITQHLDRLGVLKTVRWTKAYSEVSSDQLGIVVNSVLECRDLDVAAILQTLTADRWLPSRNTVDGPGQRSYYRWLKTSERGITKLGFSVTGTGMRGTFWYSIVVPAHPYCPPNTAIEDFVLDKIWNPVVRVLRFRTLSRPSRF